MDREEFDNDEQIVYLTFREQFSIVVLIEEMKDFNVRVGKERLQETKERLERILEKIRPELEEAFRSLGEDEE